MLALSPLSSPWIASLFGTPLLIGRMVRDLMWQPGTFGAQTGSVFFDIRVFNPFASSYSRSPLSRCYVTNEQEKRRAYDERG